MLRERKIVEKVKEKILDYDKSFYWRDLKQVKYWLDLLLEKKIKYPLYGDKEDAIYELAHLWDMQNDYNKDTLWEKYIDIDHGTGNWCINITSDAIVEFEKAIIGHEEEPYYNTCRNIIREMKELKDRG